VGVAGRVASAYDRFLRREYADELSCLSRKAVIRIRTHSHGVASVFTEAITAAGIASACSSMLTVRLMVRLRPPSAPASAVHEQDARATERGGAFRAG